MLLLTLLPFVGWAEDYPGVKVQLSDYQLEYTGEDLTLDVNAGVIVTYFNGEEDVPLDPNVYTLEWDNELIDPGQYSLTVTPADDGDSFEFDESEEQEDGTYENIFEIVRAVVQVSVDPDVAYLSETPGLPTVIVTNTATGDPIDDSYYVATWYESNGVTEYTGSTSEVAAGTYIVEIQINADGGVYFSIPETEYGQATFTVVDDTQEPPVVEEGEPGYNEITVSLSKTTYYLDGETNIKTAVLGYLQATGVPGTWFDGDFTAADPAVPEAINHEEFDKTWQVDVDGNWQNLDLNYAIDEPGTYRIVLESNNENLAFDDAENANCAEFVVLAVPAKGVVFTTGVDEYDVDALVGGSNHGFTLTVSEANNDLTPWYFSGEAANLDTDPANVLGNTNWFIYQGGEWVEFDVTEGFVPGDYKAVYLGATDSDEDDITTEFTVTANPLVEVQVYPTNTQTLTYGTPVDQLVVTPLFFSITQPAFLTDAGRQEIAEVLIFKNAEALSTANVGTAKYTLNLNKESDLYDATTGKLIITKNGTDYNIVPLGMQGEVEIVKGQNELILADDMPLITVKTDLKYTGAAQELVNIPTEGEGAEAKPAKVATLGGVQYFSIQKKDYDAAFAPEDPEAEHQTGLIIDPEDYNITNKEGVLGEVTWTDVLPTGTEVDEFYVWVRAAGDGTNYDPSAPVYIGAAKINAGVPTISGTIAGVDPTYYLKTTDGKNWKHIYTTNDGAAIVPSIDGKLYATIGGDRREVPADKIFFRINKATYNEDGSVKKDEDGNIIWDKNSKGLRVYNVWESDLMGDFKVGTYRVVVRVEAIDNFSEAFVATEPAAVFEVVKPTYTVTTVPASTTVPYDNQGSVTFGYEVTNTGYAPEFDPAAPSAEDQSLYKWYTAAEGLEAHKENGKYAAGEYNVVIPANLFNASDDFIANEPVAAQVTILAGEILAKIEPQELVYGQTLPLYLTFDSGSGIAPTDTRAINEFNSKFRSSGFKATLIRDAEGNEVTDGETTELVGINTGSTYRPNWVTTLLPVGTYKVTGDFGGDATNKILASSATWTVTPKDIANEDFDNPGVDGMRNSQLHLSKTYTSNPIELTAEDLNRKFTYRRTYLELGKDFEISDYANNVNAGTATFTITGKGNFTGTRENRRFTIDKAKIYVYPAPNQHWDIGHAVVDEDGKSIFPVDWESEEKGIYAQLEENFEQDRRKKKDMALENGFKDLAARIRVPASEGEYPDGLIAYLPEGAEEADNYEFVFKTGYLKINKGLIQIQLADQETEYIFSEPATDAQLKKFELANAADLNPILAENWEDVIVKDLTKVTITKSNWDDQTENVQDGNIIRKRYPVGDYEFTATAAAGAFTSTNYLIEVVDRTATLTVNPAEITVSAIDKTANFNDFLTGGEFDQDKMDDFVDGITEVNSANVTITAEPLGWDTYSDIVASLTVNDDNEIVVALAENDNYTVTNADAMNGTLTIRPLPGIELTSAPAVYETDKWGDPVEPLNMISGDLKTIQEKDNMPVDYVTIKLKAAALDPANEAYSQWKAYEWHAMVLPFATTVGEVAYNFGYAVVNVVDEEGTEASTKPNEVKFKLQEMEDEIPANTPFLIKAQYDFDYNNTLYFGNIDGSLAKAQNDVKPILIEYDPNPSVAAGRGITFDGTYDQKVFDNTTTNYKFLGPDSKWKRYTASSTSKYTMQPYTSYLNLTGFTGTREVVVIVEEEDGSTTAINAAEFQNLKSEGLYRVDGVKVQNANQKGVYIQDGKKFVK